MRQFHLALALPIILLLASFCRAQEASRIHDVVYGHKFGMALVMEVAKPEKPNGAGVVFMVSGGFNSNFSMIQGGIYGPAVAKAFLDRGYTLFLVCHGSQPKFTADEIAADIQRAIRFIRTNAKEYGVDPNRLGIAGISSGGFLSLSLAVFGKPGDENAKDPVDRASSRVQAVACFCPPSNLVDYGEPDRSFLEYEPVKRFAPAFPIKDSMSEAERVKILHDLSPFFGITKDTPPTFILHGDKDPLVPYEQSQKFIAKLKENNVPCELITRNGAGHTWAEMSKDHALLADWFDKYLPPADARSHE